MKNLYLLLILVIFSCTKITPEAPILKDGSLKDKYIVVLKPIQLQGDFNANSNNVRQRASVLNNKYGVTTELEEVYETALQGYAIKLSSRQVKDMESDESILAIEKDGIVTLSARKVKPPRPTDPPTPPPTPTPTQTIPWGIARVGCTTYTGTNAIWVIDSGIDLTHPDLNVSTNGVSFCSYTTSPNDDNGHGTHVAGIIAAKNNTIGVVGVAAGALVIPVKVLDSTGSGTFSGVLAGINYVAVNGQEGDVANMSLGGGISPTIDGAVLTASAKVKFAIAAGNETDNVINHSPARAEGANIYTISAMSSGDTWASFSNYGTGVDFCAPGVSIYSTYKNGGYASMSGTSMATPHVAGLLLLGAIVTDGYVKNDPDGSPDPIAHR